MEKSYSSGDCHISAVIALSFFAALVPAAALAQADDPTAEFDADAVEEIVVTGSRIKRANQTSTSPITQIDSEELVWQGVTRIEDLLNDLPQVIADQSSGTNNGSDGIATVDLRGLRPTRTLTIVNGRRLPAGTPSNPVIDVNQIPGTLIERVEVLTGGASATYGSDALAGVVNFITIKNFDGLQFDYQFGRYQHKNSSQVADLVADAGFDLPSSSVSDGDSHNFSLTFGMDTAEGNLTAYATYREFEPVVQSERDYSACALNGGPGTGGAFCGGSSTIADGRFTDFGLLTNPDCVLVPAPTPEDSNAMACNRVPQFDYSTGIPTGALDENGDPIMMNEPILPWYGNTSGSSTMPWPGRYDLLVEPGTDTFANRSGHPNAWYNYGPTNYLMRPDERITFGVLGHRELGSTAEFYLELNYMQDKTISQLAPSGSFFAVPDSISCGNPLLSQQQFDTLCAQYNLTADDRQLVFIGRRNVEGGPRTSNQSHTSARAVFGVRGDIGSTWSYDAYLNYGEVDYASVFDEDLSITNMQRALEVITHPVTGQPVCESTLVGAAPDCVPWNVFESGAVTQEAIDYITLPIYYTGDTKQVQANAYVSGDLGDYGIVLPTADQGIKVVAGLEYREESLNYFPDKTAQEGGAAGSGASISPVSGQYTVNEFFAEASIPLLEGRTAAELISLDLAYRYSDYSTGKTTDTYKFAGEWAVNSSLRFRASMQHAVRVGNIHELFQPIANGGDTMRDSCEGPAPVSSFEQCANTGVTAAQYGNIVENQGNFGSANIRFGGNSDLDPEESDTVSFGFIANPEFLPGLSLSVDYFDIEISGAIADANTQFIFDQCLETGQAQFCDAVNRDPTTALLWLGDGYIVAPKTNIGFIKTSGLDIVGSYGFGIGRFGDIDFNIVGTYVDKWDFQELPGAPIESCVGIYISLLCDGARPEWASNLRTTWTTPWDASVSLLWRYVSELKDGSGFDNHIKSMSYLDLSGVWAITDSITVRIGVNNVLDDDPPIASFGSGNTLPEAYDALGRYFFTGFSVKL